VLHFSGAFVIPLLLQHGIHAVVASQPALPFNLGHLLFGGKWSGGHWERQLMIADADLEEAARLANSAGTAVLIQRFAADRLCPRARTDRLAQAFGVPSVNYPNSPRRPRRPLPPHTLLTEEFDAANPKRVPAQSNDPTRIALQHVVDLFRQHMRSPVGPPLPLAGA